MRPSWNTSVASPALVPGTLPPMSGLWAVLPTKAMSRPWWKTGEISVTSLGWFWQ